MAWSSGVCGGGPFCYCPRRPFSCQCKYMYPCHVFISCGISKVLFNPHIRNVRQIPHSSFILDSPPPSAFLSFSVTGCGGSHFQPACRR